jgi:protein-L-isoaspartate(D-aspartate) O-methyltransferase
MSSSDLAQFRRFFAEELRATAPVRRNDSVVEAFASVPRERFLGPGPWRIIPPERMEASYVTPDADARRLYHNILVAIDERRGLNNGEPGLWAHLFDQLDLRPGERIMQVGAGTGFLQRRAGRDRAKKRARHCCRIRCGVGGASPREPESLAAG